MEQLERVGLMQMYQNKEWIAMQQNVARLEQRVDDVEVLNAVLKDSNKKLHRQVEEMGQSVLNDRNKKLRRQIEEMKQSMADAVDCLGGVIAG